MAMKNQSMNRGNMDGGNDVGSYAEDDVNKKRLRKENGVKTIFLLNLLYFRKWTSMKQLSKQRE